MLESLTSGTIAGAGSFRCKRCGYVLTLSGSDTLSDCPGCAGRDFVRASLFSAGHTPPRGVAGGQTERGGAGALSHATPAATSPLARASWLAEVRERIAEQPGEYLAYEENGELRTVALTREWTRIGRSLAADVRFDDPTVSRRHALIVRQPDGVRVLDDRSLNGVFVNGARVEGKALKDGDEIIVGRYRLSFFDVVPQPAGATGRPSLRTT
jgi:predicted  nucleic acid-binding Zn-ribbon protein